MSSSTNLKDDNADEDGLMPEQRGGKAPLEVRLGAARGKRARKAHCQVVQWT
jgi:hypothetical protein